MEAVEVGLQDLRLLRVREWTQPIALALPAPPERYFPLGLGVAYPLSAATGGHEKQGVCLVEQIDGKRMRGAGLAASNLEDPHMRGTDPNAHERADSRVEQPIDEAGFGECTRGLFQVWDSLRAGVILRLAAQRIGAQLTAAGISRNATRAALPDSTRFREGEGRSAAPDC